MTDPDISAAASAFGKMGGKAGKGPAKRRDPDFYKRIGSMGGQARHKNTKPAPKKKACPKCGGVLTYEEGAWVHKSGFAKCPKKPTPKR